MKKEYLARVKVRYKGMAWHGMMCHAPILKSLQGVFPEGTIEVDQPIEQKTFIPPLLYGVLPEGQLSNLLS